MAKASAIQWDEVVRQSAIGVAISEDPDRVLTMVNETYARMHGYTVAEMTGLPFVESYAPSFRARLSMIMETLVNKGHHSFQAMHVRKDGTTFPVQMTISLVKPTRGPGLLIAYCQDLTEQYHTRNVLAAITESSQFAIFSKDLEGRILSWNKAAEDLYGYSPSEAIGTHIYDLIVPPDKVQEVQEILAAVASGHRVDRMETIRKKKDGALVDVSITVSPVLGPDGDIFAASVAAHDITLEKQAKDALVASEARLREAQALGNIGNWELDLQTGLLIWSDEIYRIFEIDKNRFGASYEAFLDAIHPDDRELVDRAYNESVAEHKPYSIDHRLLMPDSRIKYVIERGQTEYGSEKPIRSIGTVQDITSRVETQEIQRRLAENETELQRTREQNRMRTEFLNAAAHDLNTPLTPIRLQLAVLKKQANLSPENQRSLAAMERNVKRMQVLIEDMLDAARLQSGRLDLRATTTSMVPIIDDAVAIFTEQARKAQVRIEMPPCPDAELQVDANRIIQVVFNLISNAIKFSPQGGTVHFDYELTKEHLRVSIADEGIGLTPMQRRRLFQPFSRPHEQEVGVAGGTGLGLYISRGIIEAHGGDMGAKSEGPGKGSMFWFTLPLSSKKREEEEKE